MSATPATPEPPIEPQELDWAEIQERAAAAIEDLRETGYPGKVILEIHVYGPRPLRHDVLISAKVPPREPAA